MAKAKFKLADGSSAVFDIPAGLKPAEAEAYVTNYMLENPSLPTEFGYGEAASRALKRGVKQFGTSFGDVIPAALASTFGFNEYAKKQMEEARQAQEEIQKYYGPEIASYKDVHTPGQALKYFVETVPEQVPNIAASLIPGGIGGVIGKRAGISAAEKALAGSVEPILGETLAKEEGVRAAERLYGQKAIEESIKQQALASTRKGQALGIYLGSYAQNYPEVFQNIYEASDGKLEPGAAALFTSASAALDSAFPAYLFKKIAGPGDKLLKAGITENLLIKSGMKPSLARKALAGTAEGVALEGLTEGAQEAISIQAEKFINKNSDVFTSKEWDRIMESTIRGSVAGGTFGAFGAIPERMRERAIEQKQDTTTQDVSKLPPEEQARIAGLLNVSTIDANFAKLLGVAPNAGFLKNISGLDITPETAFEIRKALMSYTGTDETVKQNIQTVLSKPEFLPDVKGIKDEGLKHTDTGTGDVLSTKSSVTNVGGTETTDTSGVGGDRGRAGSPGTRATGLGATLTEDEQKVIKYEADYAKLQKRKENLESLKADPAKLAEFAQVNNMSVEEATDLINEDYDNVLLNLKEKEKALGSKEMLTIKEGILKKQQDVEATKAFLSPEYEDEEKRIKESSGAASIYPTYESFLEEMTRPGVKGDGLSYTKEEVAKLTGIKNEEDFLKAREADIQKYVEKPAIPALQRVLAKNGTPYASNAFGIGEKGVWYLDENGEKQFEPITPQDLLETKEPIAKQYKPAPLSVTSQPKKFKQKVISADELDNGQKVWESVSSIPFTSLKSHDALVVAYTLRGVSTLPKSLVDEIESKYAETLTPNQQLIKEITKALRQVTTVGEAIKQIAKRNLNKPERALLNVLRNVPSIGSVNFSTHSKDMVGGAPGYYDSERNLVYLNLADARNTKIFLHELTHVATVKSIGNHVEVEYVGAGKYAHKALTPLGNKLIRIYQASMNSATGYHYGHKNIKEFFAEALTNAEFKQHLHNTASVLNLPPASGTGQLASLWSDLVNAIKSMFGVPDVANTLLDDVLNISPEIMGGPEVLEVINPESKISFADSDLNHVNPEVSKGLFEAMDRALQSQPQLNQVADGVKDALSKVPGWLQRAYLGLMSLPNKVELYGKQLPSLKTLLSLLENRANENKNLRDELEKLVLHGVEILKKHPKSITDKFNSITLKLSGEDIDPRDVDNLNHPLVVQYRQLPKDLQKLGIDITKKFEAYGRETIDALAEYARREGQSAGTATALRLQFENNRLKFYHPFRRFGKFFLYYKDKNNTEIVQAFESPAALQRMKMIVEKQGATDVRDEYKITESNVNTNPPTGLMAKIVSIMRNNNVDSQVINDVYEAYLSIFPTDSIRQAMKAREAIPGYVEDVVGGLADVGAKLINQLTGIKYRPQIDNAVGQVRIEAQGKGEQIGRVAEDLLAQSSFLQNPVADKWSSRASYLSYMSTIAGNVSSGVINLSQLPMIVYPILAGEYGAGQAWRAMQDAHKLYWGEGWSKNRSSDRSFMPDKTFGANPNMTVEQKDLFAKALERSAIGRGVGYELTDLRKQNAKDFTGAKAKVDTILGWIFQNTERYNREITLLAAYKLARDQNINHDVAVQKAIDTVINAHSHALAEAGPRYFQTGLGKVAFTFKRYAQAMIYLTGRLFYLATKGESKEIKDLARKQLLGIYGMTFTFAGLQGVPLYGGATLMASIINAMVGDDDEPFDPDEAVRESMGNLVTKGPLNYALSIDIASRTGFNGMIYRDDTRRISEVGIAPYITERILGPSYQTIVVNGSRGLELMNEGHVYRGIETMLPAAAKNPLKAFRFATEGATTKNGAKLTDQMGPYSSFMQVLGFSNDELAESYARANAMAAAQKKLEERRTSLIHAYTLARLNSDSEGMSDIKEKIDSFNSKMPSGFRIKGENLSKSYRQQVQRNSKSVDGIYLNKKTADYIQEKYGH